MKIKKELIVTEGFMGAESLKLYIIDALRKKFRIFPKHLKTVKRLIGGSDIQYSASHNTQA